MFGCAAMSSCTSLLNAVPTGPSVLLCCADSGAWCSLGGFASSHTELPVVHGHSLSCVGACYICTWAKRAMQNLQGLLQPSPMLEGLWQIIALDFRLASILGAHSSACVSGLIYSWIFLLH